MKKIFKLFILFSVITICLCACKNKNSQSNSMRNKKALEYTKNQVLLLTLSQKKDIESVYTSQIWEAKLEGGILYKDIFLSDMKEFFVELELLNILAQENGITLNSEEINEISKKSKYFFDMNIKYGNLFMDMTEEELNQIYLEYALAHKVKKELAAKNIEEISKSEARVMQLEQIVLNEESKAQEIFDKVTADNEIFEKLALSESIEVEYALKLAKGKFPKDIEDKIFALEDGMVSDIIKIDSKYYIFKCIKGYDEEATNQQRMYIKDRKMHEYIYEQYKDLSDRYNIGLDKGLWEEVKIQMDENYEGVSFFADYEEMAIDESI